MTVLHLAAEVLHHLQGEIACYMACFSVDDGTLIVTSFAPAARKRQQQARAEIAKTKTRRYRILPAGCNGPCISNGNLPFIGNYPDPQLRKDFASREKSISPGSAVLPLPSTLITSWLSAIIGA